MRLLGHVSRTYKKKEYHKSWIVIPSKLLTQLGWKTGQDLQARVKNGKLIVSRTIKPELIRSKNNTKQSKGIIT